MPGPSLGVFKRGGVYYPFGLTFNSYQRENAVDQNYRYNGKELQDELNLGWLDYGARMYSSDIARWMITDPLSSKYASYSPYAYVAGNPIKAIDPDGKRIWFINDEGELRRASRKLMRTLTGGKTYDKYAKSKTEDVYIAMTTVSGAGGMTVKDAHTANRYGITVNENYKGISVHSRVGKDAKEAFSIYGKINFSQSRDKKIHLISIDKQTLKSGNDYENAEAIFHEMNAHIENATGDEIKDHKLYGKTKYGFYSKIPLQDGHGNPILDDKGNQMFETVPAESPAGKVMRELNVVKKNDEQQ